MNDGGLIADKNEYKRLQELEYKAQQSAWKAKDKGLWYETTGNNYRRRWDKMILKLRGWIDYKGQQDTTKSEWLEYCKENGLVDNYNFGDILS